MAKKILFVILPWIVVAIAIFVLYLLREVSPVKDIIAWALTMWPILAVLGGAALLISGWVIKHDFKTKNNNDSLNPVQKNGVMVVTSPPQLIIRIVDVNFGLSGDSGYPPKIANGDKERWVRLGLALDSNVLIETLELVISGKERIPAYEWNPGQAAYYYYFGIPKWVKEKDNRTIQVQSFANGIRWGSPETMVIFPV